jgi:hypothetical protein
MTSEAVSSVPSCRDSQETKVSSVALQHAWLAGDDMDVLGFDTDGIPLMEFRDTPLSCVFT